MPYLKSNRVWRMVRKGCFAALAAILALGAFAAQPAAAAVMLLTYTGAVGATSVSDEAPPGSMFTLRIKYDTSRGEIFEESFPEGRSLALAGLDADVPILSAEIAIGDNAPHVLGELVFAVLFQSSYDFDDDTNIPVSPNSYGVEIRTRDGGVIRLSGYGLRGRPPLDFDAAFELPTSNSGIVNLPDLGFLVEDLEFSAHGHVRVERFVGTAVPEPATWALMIAGFGLAGAALRRRPGHRLAAG